MNGAWSKTYCPEDLKYEVYNDIFDAMAEGKIKMPKENSGIIKVSAEYIPPSICEECDPIYMPLCSGCGT